MNEIEKLSNLIRLHSHNDFSFLSGNSKAGINIYRNNYLMNLIDILKLKFPSIVKALGSNNFNYFAKLYIDSNSPKSADIGDYGEEFPHFLKERVELKNLSNLFFLATLDLRWAHAFKTKEFELEMPIGVLSLWNALNNNLPTDKIIIDHTSNEKIRLIFKADEYYFERF